ncbi:hypothetical protein [Roseiflexus castenholzii]|uniref:hypothetical protein n=1 Tax=Roseiflexus castenholzii TaxID=120962 RepID=UPI003C7C3AA7
MDMTNVIHGIAHLGHVTIDQCARLWYRGAATADSRRQLGMRMLLDIHKQGFTLRSPRKVISSGVYSFGGLVYMLSSEGWSYVQQMMSTNVAHWYGALVSAPQSRTVNPSMHSVLLTEVLTSMACGIDACASDARIACRREPLLGYEKEGRRLRADALIGILLDDSVRESSLPPSFQAQRTVWRPVNWMIWEQYDQESHARMHGLYVLELDLGYKPMTLFERRALACAAGREIPPKFFTVASWSPTPIIVTSSPQRANSIAHAWHASDPSSSVYVTTLRHAIDNPMDGEGWIAFLGGRHEARPLSPFAWLANRCEPQALERSS